MAIYKGYNAAVVVASGTSSTFTTEATTASAGNTVYTITDRTKRFWDPTATTTVYYNGGAVTSYASIQYPGGIVTWSVTPGAQPVTVTGKAYPTLTPAAQAKEWSLEVAWDFVDSTMFGNTMRQQTAVLRGATVTFNQFYADDTFHALARAGSPIGWQCYIRYDAGTPANDIYYCGYGIISGDSLNTAVDGLDTESLTLNVTDGPYYVAGVA